jgi:hypothetical protein
MVGGFSRKTGRLRDSGRQYPANPAAAIFGSGCK